MSRPILHGIVRLRSFIPIRQKVGIGKDARHISQSLSGELIEHAMAVVAKAKGVTVPEGDVGAEGDHPILDFLNAHWADILAIILKLIGL